MSGIDETAGSPDHVPERRLFLLVRVPKSGSTSLARMVSAALPNAREYFLPPPQKLTLGANLDEFIRHGLTRFKRIVVPYGALSFSGALRKIGARARSGDYISGHVPVDRVEVPGWRIDPITLLRDPFDRFLSDFNYCKVGYEKLDPANRAIRNDYVMIAGTQGLDGFVDYFWERHDKLVNTATWYVTGDANCEDPFAYLQKRYFHFGALERLNEFALGLSAKLGGDTPILHSNRTPRRAENELSAHARSKVEQMFDRDLQLYEAVLKHVDALETPRPG